MPGVATELPVRTTSWGVGAEGSQRWLSRNLTVGSVRDPVLRRKMSQNY